MGGISRKTGILEGDVTVTASLTLEVDDPHLPLYERRAVEADLSFADGFATTAAPGGRDREMGSARL